MKRSLFLIATLALLAPASAQQAPFVVKEASPKDALTKVACWLYEASRTREIFIDNRSAVKLSSFAVQGIDTQGPPNDDFATDTGVILGFSLAAGAHWSIDPCYALLSANRPVAANICLGSVRTQFGDVVELPTERAPPGYYWPRCGWTLVTDFTGKLKATLMVEPATRAEPKKLPLIKPQ